MTNLRKFYNENLHSDSNFNELMWRLYYFEIVYLMKGYVERRIVLGWCEQLGDRQSDAGWSRKIGISPKWRSTSIWGICDKQGWKWDISVCSC